MQKIIKAIYADKITGLSFSVSIGVWFLTSIITGISFFHLPPYVPIYNSMAWGYARLGTKWELGIPLLLVLFYICINSYIGIKIRSRAPLLSRFLFLTGFAISIFTSIFIIKIVLIIL